jgi:hypothetical protein
MSLSWLRSTLINYEIEAIMIPKICFSYWSGNNISFLNILTLKTFSFFNPDWKIIIYTDLKAPKNPLPSWTTDEQKIEIVSNLTILDFLISDKVSLVNIDIRKMLNRDDNIFPTYYADILRIMKLQEHGGFWIDLDILFLKPLPLEWINIENSLIITTTENTFPIGLIGSVPNSGLMNFLVENCYELMMHSKFEHYQEFGANLWRKSIMHNDFANEVSIFSFASIYPYSWFEINKYYLGEESRINDSTVGVHWFNGSLETKNFLNSRACKSLETRMNTGFF